MNQGFIHYQVRNGREYATHCISKRIEPGKTPVHDVVYLGAVVDKEKGIFKSRERGVFHFSVKDGIVVITPPTIQDVESTLSVIFGNAWFVNEILKQNGYIEILKNTMPQEFDTLMSLILFKLFKYDSPADEAIYWWQKSYSRILFPSAKMDSQRLSEFAVRLGSENTWRRFYSQHLSFMSQYDNEHVVLIDSTGLPNNIKFPLSKISNHNGKISREVRLILLIDSRTGMPLYFQYIPGNVIDVTTLKTTLAEAEALGIDIRYVILDAGYYSEENIRLLIKANIPYIIRLKAGNNDYNYLFAKYRKNLDSGDHVINYNGRILHVRRVDYELFGHKTYAYVCIDYDRQRDEMKKYYIEATNKQLKSSTIKMETEKMGFFVLLSSKRLSKIEILPYYYARQTIEQVFDIGKNYADLIPLRVHNEETFRGHLMLSFLVTTIYLMTNHLLEDTKFSAKKAYTILETIHARVFRDRITIDEAIKDVNTILNCFKLKLPSIITNVDTSITTKLFESIQKSKK